jgi:Tfp pilus assembly protein PilF
MGFFLSEAGRYDEALTYFDQAERLGKADARFYNNRGFARLGSGDARGAKKDIDRSLKMDPSNAYAYRNLAQVCFAMGDDLGGCEALERALANGFTKQYGNEVQDMRRARCR